MNFFASDYNIIKLKVDKKNIDHGNRFRLFVRSNKKGLRQFRNKMAIVQQAVSKINSEEGFYENLTLGLSKVLSGIPRVTGISYDKRQPCERTQITTWEQRHNVYLADDLRKFYLSTDGFLMTWCYQYSPNDNRRVGQINIPQLLKISLIRESMETLINALPNSSLNIIGTSIAKAAHDNINGYSNTPHLTPRSKIFEFSNITGIAKVCIVYETPDVSSCKIYLLEMNNLRWQFLADTFTEYMRMTIAHLGLPYWELCFSSCGLPSWTEQLFLLIAPHLLQKNELRRNRNVGNDQETLAPFNALDPSVFRVKPRCTRQVQKGR